MTRLKALERRRVSLRTSSEEEFTAEPSPEETHTHTDTSAHKKHTLSQTHRLTLLFSHTPDVALTSALSDVCVRKT